MALRHPELVEGQTALMANEKYIDKSIERLTGGKTDN